MGDITRFNTKNFSPILSVPFAFQVKKAIRNLCKAYDVSNYKTIHLGSVWWVVKSEQPLPEQMIKILQTWSRY